MGRIRNLASVLALVMMVGIVFAACKKDKGKPPVVPPAGTMVIDFSDFSLSGKKGVAFSEAIKDIPDPEENYMFSSQMAAIWNNIINVDLAVPVAAFKQALNNNPTWIADKTWEWSFNITGIAGSFSARLVGKNVADGAEWEMYIKKEGTPAFDEFLWFSGTTAADGNSGRWILNRNNEFPQPFLQIDWTKTGTDISMVKYTYIRQNNDSGQPDPFRTSYIEYGKQTGTYDSYFSVRIYEPVVIQDFVTVMIEWDSTTGAGRVKALHKFSDEDWHCWNDEKFNVDCPS